MLPRTFHSDCYRHEVRSTLKRYEPGAAVQIEQGTQGRAPEAVARTNTRCGRSTAYQRYVPLRLLSWFAAFLVQAWERGRRFLGVPDICLPQPVPPYIDFNMELAAASPTLYDMYVQDLLRLLSYASLVTTDASPYLDLHRWVVRQAWE